jgi:hypothetical protein
MEHKGDKAVLASGTGTVVTLPAAGIVLDLLVLATQVLLQVAAVGPLSSRY